MAYGFELRNANGTLTFSTTDTTWNYLGSYIAPANANATFSGVPVMNERLVSRAMLDQVVGDDEAYVHTYNLTGSTLYTYAPDTSNTVRTLFLVFGR